MADDYPLIAGAVAGLDKNNGENRRVLYERARAALLGQLRGLTPALNESDITRERLALEESIRKVEAESARKFVEPARQPPAARVRPIEPRHAEDVEEHSAPPRRYVNPPAQPSQESRREAGRQDVARQDLGRQDVGRQDVGRQDVARQDLARQDLARRPRPPSPPSSPSPLSSPPPSNPPTLEAR